jgi:hypothetical protein
LTIPNPQNRRIRRINTTTTPSPTPLKKIARIDQGTPNRAPRAIDQAFSTKSNRKKQARDGGAEQTLTLREADAEAEEACVDWNREEELRNGGVVGPGKVGEPDKKGGADGKLLACPWHFELFAVGGVEWSGRGGVGAVRSRWGGLMDGWDGCGCGFSVRSLLIAGLQEEWLFFSFLTGKKERGVLFCVVSFFSLLLNDVKLVAYGE